MKRALETNQNGGASAQESPSKKQKPAAPPVITVVVPSLLSAVGQDGGASTSAVLNSPPGDGSSTSSPTKGKGGGLHQDSLSGPRYRNWSERPKTDRVLSQSCRIFVLPTNISNDEVTRIQEQVTTLGALSSDYKTANIVVTQVQAPKRLQRELRALNEQEVRRLSSAQSAVSAHKREHPRAHDLESQTHTKSSAHVASSQEHGHGHGTAGAGAGAAAVFLKPETLLEELAQKIVLHTDWIEDCAERKKFLDFGPYEVVSLQTSLRQDGADDGKTRESSSSSKAAEKEQEAGESSDTESEGGDDAAKELEKQSRQQIDNLPPMPPWSDSQHACRRPTPMKSKYNQDIVDELETIRMERYLLGDDQGSLSYSRALSSIKAYPYPLRPNPEKANKITGVGEKIGNAVKIFYKVGRIPEAEIIRRDPVFQTLKMFCDVYKIGPAKARERYQQGCRTHVDLLKADGGTWKMGYSTANSSITMHDALAILPDLQTPIPRVEVEEITNMIVQEMNNIRPGVLYTVVGGYRRGKLASNDVDIVFTYPSEGDDGMPSNQHMRQLRENLAERGILAHFISQHNMLDGKLKRNELQILEMVLKLPACPLVPISRHRRVDIIFCQHKVYGAAVLGWTGSRQYERDLRVVAKKKGYKFHSSGLTVADTSEIIPTFTEEDVLDTLNLPRIPPEYRNCDA